MEIIESVKDRIKKEIDELAKKRGLLHPEDVADFAKNHKASEPHRLSSGTTARRRKSTALFRPAP